MAGCAWGPGICLLLLGCFFWERGLAAADYDDYGPNSTDAEQHALSNGLCPRAVPGQAVWRNGTLFLAIPAASRLQLSSRLITVLLPSTYTAVFLVGLPLNGLALWVLATRVEKLPSTIFLMNLAAVDLLLGFLLPFKIAYYFLGNHWPFGEGLCRFTSAAFYGNMSCSMLLLACISVDRYLAVAHPFFARSCRSRPFAVGTCSAVWVAAALLVVPLTCHRQSFPLNGTTLTLCHDVLPRGQEAEYYYYYFLCLVACGFLAPLLTMVLSSTAMLRVLLGSGQKYATAIKLTVLVLSTMVAFYTPSNVLLLLHYAHSCSQRRGTFYVAYMVSLALTTCNTCADPFVYYYVSEEFRAKVRGRLFGRRESSAFSLKTSKETLPPPRTSHSHSLA
uniref:proteinase-activated receptor 4 n=1 Tax=Euleptes europaea TaxID=460621 RepID=UPI00254075F3|nr:proteinase-activated receptor 4 [Euleptes europaea]